MPSEKKVRSVTLPRGFRAADATCGIKASGKPDLSVIVSDRDCAAAGVYTRNKCPGAPLIVTRRHLRGGVARAIVCNSGNANDATGQRGIDDASAMAAQVAEAIGCKTRQVVVGSTGVIGHFLPMNKVRCGIAEAMSSLDAGPDADARAARGIMTTDLRPKAASRTLKLGGETVRLGGIAKGSGMIAPNMATMLVYITTDAAIDAAALRPALRQAADASFNRISVDQHTSPSDMAVVLANGAAGNRMIRPGGGDYRIFTEVLTDLCRELAYMIVADGEGATKVFRVCVLGARSVRDADRIGKAVVDSPLVKTAVHGGDPNWGRVVTAAGYSGAALNPDRLSLDIGPDSDSAPNIRVFDRGVPTEINAATQRRLVAHMRRDRLRFTLDLRLGKSATEWLGCDLSRQYIAINADYST